MKRFSLCLSLLCFLIVDTKAQDIQLTQFYATPVYLNPAFTGANICTRATLAYRNQWSGVSKAYQSSLLSLDHFIDSKNLGVGLIVAQDVAGSGSLKTSIVSGSLAYRVRLGRAYSLHLGIQPGVGFKSINFNNLLFGDQISRSEKLGKGVSSVEAQTQNKIYFDIGSGILLSSDHFWAGVSALHMNTPNESFYSNPNANIPVKYSVHMGGKILLNKTEKFAPDQIYISPVVNYKHQAKFDQLDVGVYMTQNILTLGFWYRGIPVLKSYKPGYPNNDAAAFIVGLTLDKMNIGYSYDVTISALTNNSKGSHEITLTYQFCNKKKKRVNYRLVSCPKF